MLVNICIFRKKDKINIYFLGKQQEKDNFILLSGKTNSNKLQETSTISKAFILLLTITKSNSIIILIKNLINSTVSLAVKDISVNNLLNSVL